MELEAQPVGVDPRRLPRIGNHRGVRVDLPYLRLAVEQGVVETSVVDVGTASDVEEEAGVRISRDVGARLDESLRLEQGQILDYPVASARQLSSDDRVADDERAESAKDAIAVGCVGPLDDQEVVGGKDAARMVPRRPDELADRRADILPVV